MCAVTVGEQRRQPGIAAWSCKAVMLQEDLGMAGGQAQPQPHAVTCDNSRREGTVPSEYGQGIHNPECNLAPGEFTLFRCIFQQLLKVEFVPLATLPLLESYPPGLQDMILHGNGNFIKVTG